MRLWTLVPAAVALLALPACGGDEAEPRLQPGAVRIGVLVPAMRSGGADELLASGAQVAAAELNNGGGIDGVARVELVTERPPGTHAYAEATRLLLGRDVSAILVPCGEIAEVASVARSRAVLLAPCARRSDVLPPFVFATGLPIDDSAVDGKPTAGGKLDEFYERFKALYGRRPPSSIPALGYDAVKVFAVATQEAGSRRPAAIEQQLREGLEAGGAFGRIRFEQGNRRPEVSLLHVS